MANPLDIFREGRLAAPFREFKDIEDTFDRLMGEMMTWRRRHGGEEAQFSPSCEASEDEKSYIMKFDLPGVNRENVKVEVNNDILSVSAERKEEKTEEDKKRHFSEISYGSYFRSFSLPSPVDPNKVDAKFEKGVLTVTVPKAPGQKTKQIDIH